MFPHTEAAMAAFVPLFEAKQTKQPDRTAPFEERMAWHHKRYASEVAEAAVVSTYASELLPAILGGTWKETDSSIRDLSPDGELDQYGIPVPGRPSMYPRYECYGEPVYSRYYLLFDHPLHFRRAGTSGRATWRNAVVVGQPYNTFEKLESSVRLAKQLAATHHVGVWARPDLSAHYPGSTALVIAGKDLRAADAGRFGFTHLAGE